MLFKTRRLFQRRRFRYPIPALMRAAAENQFFYLTFSQYINLNQRVDINLNGILEMLQIMSDFETLRAELTRPSSRVKTTLFLLPD
jgi:hypothetical protein